MNNRLSKPMNKVKSDASSKRREAGWNSYLTDDKYKISQESLLKKKQLYVSKNNILASGGCNKAPRIKKIIKKKEGMDDISFVSDIADNNLHVDEDAIDFLDMENIAGSLQDIRKLHKTAVSHKSDCVIVKPTMKPPFSHIQAAPVAATASKLSTNVMQVTDLDEDMIDIIEQISVLSGELKYYEELSGKKSIFDTDVG